MKLLICGANGQLGNELARQLGAGKSALGTIPQVFAGAQVAGVDIEDGDLANREVALALVEKHAPDVVLNATHQRTLEVVPLDVLKGHAFVGS